MFTKTPLDPKIAAQAAWVIEEGKNLNAETRKNVEAFVLTLKKIQLQISHKRVHGKTLKAFHHALRKKLLKLREV